MHTLYKQLLDDFINKESQNVKSRFSHFPTLLNKFATIKMKNDILNQYTGHAYNYLRYFDIGETKHSFIIKEFLEENGGHGQKRLFLNQFLEDVLKIQNSVTTKWYVTSEIGRIDIMLKSDEGHIVIIENKSNNAIDQQNQLYRYWLQEIYYPFKDDYGDLLLSTGFYSSNESGIKFKIIYLPSDRSKAPNPNSITRPKEYELSELPLSVPIQYQVVSFKHEIVMWLSNCLKLIPTSNQRLIEFVKMYIEISKNLNS